MTIGIIPAGGKAERMDGIPKMLLPTPRGLLMDVLMDRMEACAPSEIVVGANHEQLRLMNRYGSRARFPSWHTDTISEMVIRADTRYAQPSALFGMPDTYFEDDQAFPKLIKALDKYGADVAVGVFRARPGQHREGGMCRVKANRVIEVVDKPDTPFSPYIWGVLAWQPSFWQFIDATDPHVGYALPKAIAAGLNVRAVLMEGGFFDCGTPERYFALIRHLTEAEPVHAP